MESSLVSENNINFDLVFKKLEFKPFIDRETTVVDTLISASTKEELEFLKEVCIQEQEYLSGISFPNQIELLESLESAVVSRGRSVYEKLSYEQKKVVTFSKLR